jgi:tight adherence protein C
VRATLVAAGSPNFYTAEEFLALSLAWGLACGLAMAGLTLASQGAASGVLTAASFAAGVAVTLYYMHDKARRRVRQIARRVPYSLDLISLAMGAGSTFTEAAHTVAREAPEDPMNAELNTVLAEMELGTTRRQALLNLAERVPLESLRGIVASIIQAEQLGTPLGDVLKGQATLLRLHRGVRAEKLAALASVRILLPSVLILLSVVLTVFAPVLIRAFRGELF